MGSAQQSQAPLGPFLCLWVALLFMGWDEISKKKKKDQTTKSSPTEALYPLSPEKNRKHKTLYSIRFYRQPWAEGAPCRPALCPTASWPAAEESG